ncbi:MAG: polyphosphate kinase 1 [bacterium]|nr:polyphosphate kinase 1 [bacterium]
MKNIFQIREVSALSFNERVLQEAEDTRNPLMERLKFLGIFSSNMDEFFKVRVASIHRRIELGKKGMDAVLEAVGERARHLDERFQKAYADITAGLADEGIRILTERDVESYSSHLADWVTDYFRTRVLPFLVPIILHKGFPFPQLTDSALYFGVKMWGSKPRYAILEIPSDLPRFVELPNGCIMYIDDVIRHSLNEVFYIFDYDQIEAYEFKISRDAELDIDNDFSEGYVRKMEKVLQQRKGGRPTRLVTDATIPPGLRKLLVKELNIGSSDTVITGGRYHNMKDLMRFPSQRKDLVFETMETSPHPVLDRDRSPMYDTILQQDVLVTYPYQSFDHVIRLLREAAIDPAVEEIKMTLYRTARASQVVNTLVNAARNGKRVFVSIELQARFDEANNIEMAERLIEAGVKVAYGVPPRKVHAKLLYIRKKDSQIIGLSTGNYNEVTGRLYVDSILMTADKRLAVEVARVFDFLATAAKTQTFDLPKFKHLMVSPFNSRRAIMAELNKEKAKGEDGYVLMKVNHLTDKKVIRRIREAANAGVQMDLVVRTTYALRPHPNIRAISILDRYLEHQRVYVFGKGEDRRVYMGSADLMERNLDWRVEVAFPIYSEELKQQVVDMMELQVADTYKARVLDETQQNEYVSAGRARSKRVQYETHHYHARMFCQADKAAPTPTP